MGIIFDSNKKIFHINAGNTSYVIGFKNNNLVHAYWGKKISTFSSIENVLPELNPGFMSSDAQTGIFKETLPIEYSTFGNPDLRYPAFHAHYTDGSSITELIYKEHRIYGGKKCLEGLPSTFAAEDEAQSLEIVLCDAKTGVEVTLVYSAYENLDVITRSVRVKNNGAEAVDISNVLSASVDFVGGEFNMLTLNGAWARERHIQSVPVGFGLTAVESRRGASSHSHNPFFALADKTATEDYGRVYAMNFVYSGNFIGGAERNHHNITRMFMGINPFNFKWHLAPCEEFTAPEVVMVYSDNGFGDMSRTYHKLYKNHLCHGEWAHKERPVLVNNWEGTYFDFDEGKILDIARKAKELDIDLMVLDDGWFGKRDDDTTSLGDWFEDRKKLPNGVDGLSEKIEELGMKFGLWFEPEMVSPVSELYKKHPDWCLQVPQRKLSLGRNQLILDYSNREVCDYIIDVMSGILDRSKISYIKWDMNRNMSEVGSLYLPPERQGEVAHRYILGLYYVMQTLNDKYPEILFEGCSGGGGRFDPGILYYMPQIWTSDDSDAVERLFIQYGTSFAYPAVSMGAHITAVPNHQVGRTTPIQMRADVALMGQFGFELDLSKMTDEEIAFAKLAIEKYKRLRNTIHNGDMYRLISPFESNNAAWEFVSPDKREVVLACYNILGKPNGVAVYLKATNLCPDSMYEDTENGILMSGGELMNIGLQINTGKDFSSKIYVFTKKEQNNEI